MSNWVNCRWLAKCSVNLISMTQQGKACPHRGELKGPGRPQGIAPTIRRIGLASPCRVGLTLAVNTFQISARCRGAIHCALWDASTPQVGAMNCAPTPHLSSLRLFEMYWRLGVLPGRLITPQIFARQRARCSDQLLRRPGEHDLTAVLAAVRAQIDDP